MMHADDATTGTASGPPSVNMPAIRLVGMPLMLRYPLKIAFIDDGGVIAAGEAVCGGRCSFPPLPLRPVKLRSHVIEKHHATLILADESQASGQILRATQEPLHSFSVAARSAMSPANARAW